MDDLKVTGIVINSVDYKENDKLVTIYTLELGIIKAQLRGVKQAKSKLKFACQPFFVGEFFLVKKSAFYQITTVNNIDSFFELTANYDRYLCASVVLETIKLTQKEEIINEQLFVCVLKTIEMLCYEETVNENMILIKYLLNFLSLNGYALNFNKCSICGIKLTNASLNVGVGGFVCDACKDPFTHTLEKNVFSSLKIINNTDLQKLSTVKLQNSVLLKCMLLLKININSLFKVNLNSVNKMLL